MREIKVGQVYRRRGVTMAILETVLRDTQWSTVRVAFRGGGRAPVEMWVTSSQAQQWARGATLEIGAR